MLIKKGITWKTLSGPQHFLEPRPIAHVARLAWPVDMVHCTPRRKRKLKTSSHPYEDFFLPHIPTAGYFASEPQSNVRPAPASLRKYSGHFSTASRAASEGCLLQGTVPVPCVALASTICVYVTS